MTEKDNYETGFMHKTNITQPFKGRPRSSRPCRRGSLPRQKRV